MLHNIQTMPEKEWLADFCRRNHILKLSLFGSVLRDDFSDESDIDALVEFEPDHVIGYIGLAELELALSEKFGRKVDLRTSNELSKYFRDDVIRGAETLYVEK